MRAAPKSQVQARDEKQQGDAREELTAEQIDLLRKLADGGMDEQTRATLIPLLAKNEVAMEFLAEATT